MEAKRGGLCGICSTAIPKGAMVVPVDVAQESDGTLLTHWLHEKCALDHSLDRSVCKHWKRTGKCMYEKSCVFAHPPSPGLRSAELHGHDTATDSIGAGATKEEEISHERTWQSESERGQPVRLHASCIPMCIPTEQLRAVFAQYGQLVDNFELRPMKHIHATSAPLGWSILKYADFSSASRAVHAINGRLRFDPKTGEIITCAAPGESVKGAALGAARAAPSSGSGNSKERGAEWERFNRQAQALNVHHFPATKLWFAPLSRKLYMYVCMHVYMIYIYIYIYIYSYTHTHTHTHARTHTHTHTHTHTYIHIGLRLFPASQSATSSASPLSASGSSTPLASITSG
jgi:hypothetical protein